MSKVFVAGHNGLAASREELDLTNQAAVEAWFLLHLPQAGTATDACVYLMKNYSSPEIINVGWGRDISIAELAEMIGEIVGFQFRSSAVSAIPTRGIASRPSIIFPTRTPLR